MIGLLTEIENLARVIVRLAKSQLSRQSRIALVKAYVVTFLLHRYDARNLTANIAGFRVRFCAYESLAYVFNEVFVGQEYHFESSTESPFIIDGGSNIGVSMLFFKMLYPQAEILCFEPNAEAYSCLQSNVAANGLEKVDTVQAALVDRDGPVAFFYDKSNPGSLVMSVVEERIPKDRRTVDGLRLSQFIGRDVDFLKLDIEGAEMAVLQELADSGKLANVRQMVVEYHHHIVKDEDVLSQMLQLLERSGFGYQIEGHMGRPLLRKQFQDILIYAYRR